MGYGATEEIGKIESVRLGIEGHGIFTFIIQLEFDGSGQCFGTYGLDSHDKTAKDGLRPGWRGGIPLLRSILEACEVDWWDDLIGKVVRVRREDGLIRQIGHAYKNRWSRTPAELLSRFPE